MDFNNLIVIGNNAAQFGEVFYRDPMFKDMKKRPRTLVPRGYMYENLQGMANGTIVLCDQWDKNLNFDQRDAWKCIIATRRCEVVRSKW